MGKRAGEVLQNRIEPHLRTHLQPHRAVGFGRCMFAWRARHTTEFIPRKARHESYVEWIVRRKWTSVHGIGNTPAPTELHGADIHFIHLRGDDRPVTLLD